MGWDKVRVASFEWSGDLVGVAVLYEVGFLDSTSSFAVLVVTDDNSGGLEGARQIANIINDKLNAL